jgi:glycosyltransferase involved in cell wall biosynthesis
MRPLVTALIDTYNHESYIESAINSVLEQDFPASEMEILVVDDGSTDRTPKIVQKFAPRVRLLRKKNGGQASAINAGSSEAKGDIVAFLDGDDLWFPNKLSRVTAEFEKNPALILAYHRFCFWDIRDNSVSPGSFFNDVSGDVLGDRRKLLIYGAAPTSSLTFRREALRRLMPVPEECSFMHDAYLTATAICLGPVLAIGECLTKNRIHGTNLWFAKEGEVDAQHLRRRMQARQAAINSVRRWVQANRPAQGPSMRRLLRGWKLVQDRDEFQIKPPGRFCYSGHLCRENLIYVSPLPFRRLAYAWLRVFAALFLGHRHLHYFEGIRTRTKRALDHCRRAFGMAEGTEAR